MQKQQNEVIGLIDRFLQMVFDALRIGINWFISNFVQLFQELPRQPAWKWVLIVVVIAVIIFYLWQHIVAFFTNLVNAAAALLYAIPGLLVLGLVAFFALWFVRNVHFPYLDTWALNY